MRGFKIGLTLMLAMTAVLAGKLALAAPTSEIRLALQEGGTASWEAAAMQALQLDKANGITLTIRGVADSKATQVALQSGEVDVILSDFIWTSLQRHQGADFTFVPHSLAVGGLMTMGKVTSLADLKGATLAVAGGPVDKSYLVLQAYYAAEIGRDLSADATIDFGAPPLVNELLANGRADASLNFWHFNARALVAGAVQVVSVQDMLAALGVTPTPPLLGWVFSERWATEHPAAIAQYLDASFQTKQALLTDDSLWDTIRPVMKAEDDRLFTALRDAYRAGIVTSYTDADIQAARQTYALLAKYGGADLTGNMPDLAQGTFWAGYRK